MIVRESHICSSTVILNSAKEAFSVDSRPNIGPSFILPSGEFLNISMSDIEKYWNGNPVSYPFHGVVDDYLAFNKKVIDYADDGYRFCELTNSIKVNSGSNDTIYIALNSVTPTSEQYKSILEWLDFIYNIKDYVDVYESAAMSDKNYVRYYFNEYIPDDILKRIKRYYSSGRLYEYKYNKGVSTKMNYKNNKTESYTVMHDIANPIDKDDESIFDAAYYDRDFLVIDPASGNYCECEDCGWFGDKDELVKGKCPDCGGNDIVKENLKRINENYNNELDLVVDHFGTTNVPYNGPTFILPDGQFLNIKDCSHHSDVEKWLIDNGYSNNEYIKTAGSKTLYNLGCIRCDTNKYYLSLPFNNQPTGEQYNSLLLWLDDLQKYHNAVEVITPDEQHIMYKFDDDVISDTVVDKIRNYYYSGTLREAKNCDTKHAHNFIYDRNKAGSLIQKPHISDSNKIVKEELYEYADAIYDKLPINVKNRMNKAWSSKELLKDKNDWDVYLTALLDCGKISIDDIEVFHDSNVKDGFYESTDSKIKLYKVIFELKDGQKSFEIKAIDNYDAIEMAASKLDKDDFIDFYDIFDNVDSNITVDDYIKDNNLVETKDGYVKLVSVEEISTDLKEDNKKSINESDVSDEIKVAVIKKFPDGSDDFMDIVEDLVDSCVIDLNRESDADISEVIRTTIDNGLINIDKRWEVNRHYADNDELTDEAYEGLYNDIFSILTNLVPSDNKDLEEDTIKKKNGKWVNRGDDGEEHGEFKTKKAADAQRKAMYANGYKGK